MSEISGLWYDTAVGILGGLLLVAFFRGFLSASRVRTLGFGAAYVTVRYALDALFELAGFGASEGFSVFIVILARYFVVFFSLLLLSRALFHADKGLSAFLVCSFLAVLEISMLIAVCCMVLFGNLTVFITNQLVLHNAIGSFAEAQALIVAFSAAQIILNLAVYFSCCLLTMRYITRSFRHKGRSFLPVEWMYIIVPCLVGVVVVTIPFEYIMDSARFVQISFSGWVGVLAGLGCLIMIAGAVKLFQKMLDLRVEESEHAVLRQQTARLHEQVRSADDIYAEIKGMRHDIKSHAANIGLLAHASSGGDENAGAELAVYLGKLEESLERFDFAFRTGNSVSDVIIHQKYLEARKNGIEFSSDFVYPADMGLDPYVLAIILSNALENAAEACLTVQGNRFIRVGSYRKGSMFFLEFENSFAGEIVIDEHTGLPQSGKEDKSAHGMGLSNIRRCARKHFGDITVETAETEDGKVFRLTVMLQGDFTANKP